MSLSGREKATILLSLLGADLAEKILSYLPEDLADLITSGINRLPTPSSDAIKSVLDEFAGFVSLPSAEKQAPFPVETTSSEPEREARETKTPFDAVFYTPPKKLAMALSSERAPVCAYVLSLMPAVASVEVLSLMPERKREIESLMKTLKKPASREKMNENILKALAEKIERISV
ncbi:MAG: hypothetical protein AABZ57_07135 [Candidatus Margulisiibacteriota bacterium]